MEGHDRRPVVAVVAVQLQQEEGVQQQQLAVLPSLSVAARVVAPVEEVRPLLGVRIAVGMVADYI
jgi:hypothetical protein